MTSSKKKRKYKSSRPEMFCEKRVLRNFANFTEQHLCQSLFFNKVVSKSTFSCRTPPLAASGNQTSVREVKILKKQKAKAYSNPSNISETQQSLF